MKRWALVLAFLVFVGDARADMVSTGGGGSTTGGTCGALGGDLTGTCASATVAKINGTSVPTNAAADQLLRTTGAGVASWATLADCSAAGKAVTYDTTTHAFGCNTISSGAPTTATYITQTADAGLSAEQAIGVLSSGILRGANTTGVITSLGDVLPVANGGTGASSFTGSRCIESNAGGTALVVTAGACVTSGGLTIDSTTIAGGGADRILRENAAGGTLTDTAALVASFVGGANHYLLLSDSNPGKDNSLRATNSSTSNTSTATLYLQTSPTGSNSNPSIQFIGPLSQGGTTSIWNSGVANNGNASTFNFASNSLGGLGSPVLLLSAEGAGGGQVEVGKDGTAALPGLTFANDTDTGLYRSAANEMSVAIGGVLSSTFNAAGIYTQRSTSGQGVAVQVSNLSDTSGADAGVILTVAGTSSGDPEVRYIVTGGSSWTEGIDNSDSDKFKISQSNGALGTNDVMSMTTTMSTTFNNGANAVSPVCIQDNGANALCVIDNASTVVNGLTVQGGATGVGPTLGTAANNAPIVFAPNGTGQILIPNGSETKPMLASSTSTTSGLWFSGASPEFSISGVQAYDFNAGELRIRGADGTARVVIGSGGSSPQLRVEGDHILQQGADAATASAQTFKGPDSTGATIAGAAFTIAAGNGTSGVANGGNMTVRGGAKNSTGKDGATIVGRAQTVATLPVCAAGTQGAREWVTDALTPVALAVVVGGGAVVQPVFCDGTNWIVG